MYKFQVDKITVSKIDGDLDIIPKSVNIIIGPNNSGKSRFLKEIRDYMSGDNRELKIIKSIEHNMPDSLEDFDASYQISERMTQDRYGNWAVRFYSNKPNQELDMSSSLENFYSRGFNYIGGSWREFFRNFIEQKDKMQFLQHCGGIFFQYIGTEERLTICKTQRNYGCEDGNINYLSMCKFKQELLKDLNENIFKLFKKQIFLDFYSLGQKIAFRIGDDFSYMFKTTNPNTSDINQLMRESKLDDQGDGLKSYVSTFLALNLQESNILLIDEPEAFLHPPLARQLGELIGQVNDETKQVFVATHSVEVLKGILSTGTDVNIIRITQPQQGQNEINIIDNLLLQSILERPLLRVSRVMEGLFCEKVIITESEADELVYQELTEKLYPQSGLYFAHGQNKQTLVEIAEMYQRIGISYEIIVDFDVLRRPDEFQKFLSLMPFDERWRQRLISYSNNLRDIVNNSVCIDGLSSEDAKQEQKSQRDKVYHEIGVSFFSDLADKIYDTLKQLSENHLQVLESGELETLLIPYGIPYNSNKKEWIELAISKIQDLCIEDISSESAIRKIIDNIIK